MPLDVPAMVVEKLQPEFPNAAAARGAHVKDNFVAHLLIHMDVTICYLSVYLRTYTTLIEGRPPRSRFDRWPPKTEQNTSNTLRTCCGLYGLFNASGYYPSEHN